jgi:hypothetical protein
VRSRSGFVPKESAEDLRIREDFRLRSARNRILFAFASAVIRPALFFLALSILMGPALLPYRLQVGGLILLFAFVPACFLTWRELMKARQGIAALGEIGKMTPLELAAVDIRRSAIRDEMRSSKPYIDVLHHQIGDSLAESERQVMQVIEQIGSLVERSTRQRESIGRSMASGKILTENTCARVEQNKATIAAIEAQLSEQTIELRSNFERIQGLAKEIGALTPLIKVITSIAQQTSLLALNAEIEPLRQERRVAALQSWPSRSASWPCSPRRQPPTSRPKSKPRAPGCRPR